MKAKSEKGRKMIPAAARASKSIRWERLAAILSGFDAIESALVFGSTRDGLVRAGSDLDIAVSLGGAEAGSIDLLLEIVGRVEEEVGVTCDLAVLNTAGPVLRHEALQGRVLFVRTDCEDSFSDFYARTSAEYEDLMAWRARQHRSRRRS